MEEQEKICRICLKKCGNDFEVIETSATKILVYLLKSNLFINEAAVMCANCAEIMKDCYHFKRICLDVEDSVVVNPNDNDAKLTAANEADSYEKCRLCMGSLIVCSFTSLDNKPENFALDQMLNKCLPELDLRATEKPIACVPCRVSLQRYFHLITNFSLVEEKIKKYLEAACADAIGPITLKNVLEFTRKNTLGEVNSIKTEDEFCGDEYVAEQKCRNLSKNMSLKTDVREVDRIKVEEILYKELDCKMKVKPKDLIKMEDQQSNDMPKFTIKCEEDDSHQVDIVGMKQSYCQGGVNELEIKQENLNSLQDDDIWPQIDSNFNLPMARECSLTQPDRTPPQVKSEIAMYPCEHCSFQAERKGILKKHLLIHKNLSEVTTYQCEHCSYQTKDKSHLKRHFLIHKSPSEIPVYQCKHCSFQTKHKTCINRHLLRHKNPSEINMYHCAHCLFQTKYKNSLKSHLLTHVDPSKATFFQCEHCPFQTKHKESVRTHLLTHKSPSEITMYPCEYCSFQTKIKWDLKKHLLSHKNLSEVTTYRCEQCSFQTKYKGDLKSHLMTHKSISEVTVYQCESCSFQSRHKKSLNRHLLTHIIMHQCERCSFQTKHKNCLKRHLLGHKNPSETTQY